MTTRERFEAPVKATEAVVLPILKQYNSTIAQLHFQYGHPLVIQAALKNMNGTHADQYKQFPMVAVMEDFPAREIVDGLFVVTPRIIIAMRTKEEYNRVQREDMVFEPILWVIANELKYQLQRTPYLTTNFNVPGSTTERPFWGREGLYGSDGNILDAPLDCIEISGKEFSYQQTRGCESETFKNF